MLSSPLMMKIMMNIQKKNTENIHSKCKKAEKEESSRHKMRKKKTHKI
jgi:hypothetical protein